MEKVNWYIYKFCNMGEWKIPKSYHVGNWESFQIVLIWSSLTLFSETTTQLVDLTSQIKICLGAAIHYENNDVYSGH